jgi:hypothetical protein
MVDTENRTSTLDRAGAIYFFGDETVAGVAMPLDRTFSVIHPEDRDRILEHTIQNITRGGPCLFSNRVVVPSGDVRHVQVRGFFGPDDRGRLIGRGVFIDISDQFGVPFEAPRGMPKPPDLPYAPLFDSLAKAAAHGVEVREALGQSGHGALRLAADLLLFEISTALAERLTMSDKPLPSRPDKAR